MQLVPQLLAVDGEERHVVRGVAGHHHPLPAEAEVVRRGEVRPALQGPQQVPECCVDQQRPVHRPGDDEAQLGGDDDTGDGVLVAGEDSAGGGDLDSSVRRGTSSNINLSNKNRHDLIPVLS